MIKKVFLFLFRKLSPLRYASYVGVKFGSDCRFINVTWGSEPYLVKLGNHVSATNVTFVTHDGAIWILREKRPQADIISPIVVGNNVFLGLGSIILPGVKIGDNVIVGAYSVITKDVPDNSVVAGIPARKIKTLQEYVDSSKVKIEDTKQMSVKQKRVFYSQKYKID